MRVKVTQDHIDRGVRREPCLCPIALALKDLGVDKPNVHFTFVRWEEWGADGIFERLCLPNLPAGARKFVKLFDEGESVKPFEFDLTH